MNAHDHRFDPVAELKANVSVPFNRAKAMPKSVYASEEFAAREVSDIFARQWFSLGRASSLASRIAVHRSMRSRRTIFSVPRWV